MNAKNAKNKKNNVFKAVFLAVLGKHSIILALLFAALVIYFVATFISLQSKVDAAQDNIAVLNQTKDDLNEENTELKEVLENGDEAAYIEKIAREQYDYALPDERVYIDS